MNSTYQSITVNAPVKDVWNKIKDFHDMSWCPNVITGLETVGDKSGTELGAKRILNGAFHEELLSVDADNHVITYSIYDGPSPISPADVKNYVGKIKLHSSTLDNQTFFEWSSSWENNSDAAVEFCHGIYVALLGEIKAAF